MAASYERVVCIDSGGSRVRAGFAGEAAPRADVPNVTARMKRQQRLLVADEVDTKVKDRRWVRRGDAWLRAPRAAPAHGPLARSAASSSTSCP